MNRLADYAEVTLLESLTDELRALRDEWLAHALSTETADREQAEHGIRLAYERAGLPSPKCIVWCGSPMGLAMTIAILRSIDLVLQRADRFWSSLEGTVASNVADWILSVVGDSVCASVKDSVAVSLRVAAGANVDRTNSAHDAVSRSATSLTAIMHLPAFAKLAAVVNGEFEFAVIDRVRKIIEESVETVSHSLYEKAGAGTGTTLWDIVEEAVSSILFDIVGHGRTIEYGQHDAAVLGRMDTFTQLGLSTGVTTDGLQLVGKSAGWWSAFPEIAFVSERPSELHFDEYGQLHSLTGPAIRYPDGWCIHVVCGVPVVVEVTEVLESSSVEHILNEVIERRGAAHIMLRYGRIVTEDDYGKLWQLDRSGDEPIVMVEVRDATPLHELGEGATLQAIDAWLTDRDEPAQRRFYFLRVPPTTRTPLDACAWCAEMTSADYKQIAMHT